MSLLLLLRPHGQEAPPEPEPEQPATGGARRPRPKPQFRNTHRVVRMTAHADLGGVTAHADATRVDITTDDEELVTL